MSAALQGWWRRRAARERFILLAGAGVVLVAMLYVLAVEPLLAAGRQAAAALPELRRQASEMRAMAAEAGQLAARARSPAPAVGVADLNAGLAGAGLVGRVTAQGEAGYAVQLEAAPMSGLVTWLEQAQRGQRLYVRHAQLRAVGQGKVSGRLLLGN